MKRFICVMLTLIMLVSLVPATAITASAASLSTSEAAITVLKKMTTFKSTCYRVGDTQEFRVGYGTVCEKDHVIDAKGNVEKYHTGYTEKAADAALRTALKKLDKKVNSFASSNKLTFKQYEHDALVVFSYGVGTAWMNGTGTLKTAIINDAGASELLSAMATVGGSMDRHKIEVNMYINGTYSNVVPGIFTQVTYDANGGSMAQGSPYTMYYDSSVSKNHPATPALSGYIFMGWYADGKWLPKLDASCSGKTLTAYWQPKGMELHEAHDWMGVDYTMKKSQLASSTIYDRPEAKSDYKVGSVKDSTVHVRCEFIAADGGRWAQIGDYQWVLVKKGSNGINNDDIDIDVTVTVTNSYVNRRVNASTSSDKNGSYKKGDKVRIITTANGSGMLWGQVAASYEDNTPVGWIALMYTNWNTAKDDDDSVRDPEESTPSKILATATVTFNGYVNLRNEPGTDNKIVGSLYKNDTVDIYEIKTVNGHQWGRTNGGWLCLTYTSLTMTDGNSNKYVSSEGALNYTFSGKITEEVAPKVSPSANAEEVDHYYIKKHSDGTEKYRVDLWPAKNQDVTITNMTIADGSLWVRISWREDLDKNGKNDTTKSGWVELDTENELSTSSSPVQMYGTDFKVVANDVTVRTAPGSGADPLKITLNKDYEVRITRIQLVGENIWGYLSDEYVVAGPSTMSAFDGWVNLATKYFVRASIESAEEPDDTLKPIGKTATVVGATSVNVRITGATTATKVGSLPIGTTANVLQVSEDGGWYNLDIDVDHNPETGSWVSAKYLSIKDGYVNGADPDNGSNGSNTPAPIITGKGVVANTYSGVNIRSGAGTGYTLLGKLLPGTLVDILEIQNGGATKWGRVKEGWVCMDYITMLSQDVTYPDTPTTPDGSQKTDSYEELERTTTTAIYTGSIPSGTPIYADPSHEYVDEDGNTIDGAPVVRYANGTEKVTVYELLTVKEMHLAGEDDSDGHGTSVEIVVTSYWARVNDGYIFNPQDFVSLDALDEKVHTVAGIEKLNIRDGANGEKLGDPLKQGTQVKITSLEIIQDKVWGRTDIERNGTLGWIRLDYTAEGAWVVEDKPENKPTEPPKAPIIGDGGNNGGTATPSGYRYTGTVVGAKSVNVRSQPSTDATITTSLKSGAALVIYETQTVGGMAWGRCDAGWIYLYYVDMTPAVAGPVDCRVTGNSENTIIYTDSDKSGTAGTYARQSVVDIYEVVGNMSRTELGWVSNTDFLR